MNNIRKATGVAQQLLKLDSVQIWNGESPQKPTKTWKVF